MTAAASAPRAIFCAATASLSSRASVVQEVPLRVLPSTSLPCRLMVGGSRSGSVSASGVECYAVASAYQLPAAQCKRRIRQARLRYIGKLVAETLADKCSEIFAAVIGSPARLRGSHNLDQPGIARTLPDGYSLMA